MPGMVVMEPSPYTVRWNGNRPMPAVNVAAYRSAIVELAEKLKPRIVIEVGVYSGGLTQRLSAVSGIQEYYVVDDWQPEFAMEVHKMDRVTAEEHMNQIADDVLAWAKKVACVHVLRMPSLSAVQQFEDGYIDFWHQDGLHTFDGLTSDIRAWWPKIREGGILTGDNFEIPEVEAAVNSLLPHRKFLARGRVWWAPKLGSLSDGG